MPYLAGLNVSLVHFHRNRAHDDVDREYQTKSVFSSDQDACGTGHRSRPDPNLMANSQVRMRLRSHPAHQAVAEALNLAIGQRRRMSVETYESDHAGQLQDPQTVF